jgi:hypothetical protein
MSWSPSGPGDAPATNMQAAYNALYRDGRQWSFDATWGNSDTILVAEDDSVDQEVAALGDFLEEHSSLTLGRDDMLAAIVEGVTRSGVSPAQQPSIGPASALVSASTLLAPSSRPRSADSPSRVRRTTSAPLTLPPRASGFG